LSLVAGTGDHGETIAAGIGVSEAIRGRSPCGLCGSYTIMGHNTVKKPHLLDETLNQGPDAVVIKNPRMSFEKKKKKKIGV